ncbi:MAG: hypothetical protein U5J98_08170 [Halobacteriales archaeon]|nr:hypothetical protein [Halobacteriales archaeon]
MLITDDRTMLPIIQTRLSGTGSVGGSRTVLLRASHAVTSLIYADEGSPPTVWMNVTSPRASLWIDHLETKSGVGVCTLEDDTAACPIETDRIHITRVQIDIEIE